MSGQWKARLQATPPNQALEPTTPAVTIPAAQEVAPAGRRGSSLTLAKMRDLFQTIRNILRMKKQPPGNSFRRDQTVALASPMCVGPDRRPIMHMQRIEVPEKSDLTGWLLACGEESGAILGDASAWIRVSLPSFVREDPTLSPIVDSPVESEWTRNKKDMIWRRIVGNKVIDAYGHTLVEFENQDEAKKG